MTPKDQPGLLPAKVVVVFPRLDEGVPGEAVHTETVTLVSLNLPEVTPNSGFDGEKVLRTTSAVDYSSGGSPVTPAEPADLARVLAEDWYRWQLGRPWLAYAQIVPYTPDGLTDLIEWEWATDSVATRVYRGPVDGWGSQETFHSGVDGSGPPGGSGPCDCNIFTHPVTYTNHVTYTCPTGSTSTVTVDDCVDWYFYGNVTYTCPPAGSSSITSDVCVTWVFNGPVTFNGPVDGPGLCGPTDINYPRHLHCGDPEFRRWYTSHLTRRLVTPSANFPSATFLPFIAPREAIYGRIAVFVTTGAAGTSRLGIYKAADPAAGDLHPLDLVVDAGLVDTSVTGLRELDIDVTLSPCELYYLVFATNGTATLQTVVAEDFYPVWGFDSDFTTGSFAGPLFESGGGAGAFATTFGGVAAPVPHLDNVPLIGLQLKCPWDLEDCDCGFDDLNPPPDPLEATCQVIAGDTSCECLEIITIVLALSNNEDAWLSDGTLAEDCGQLLLDTYLYCDGPTINDWKIDWRTTNVDQAPGCDGESPNQKGTAKVVTAVGFEPSCDPFSMYFDIVISDLCCDGSIQTSTIRIHITDPANPPP